MSATVPLLVKWSHWICTDTSLSAINEKKKPRCAQNDDVLRAHVCCYSAEYTKLAAKVAAKVQHSPAKEASEDLCYSLVLEPQLPTL